MAEPSPSDLEALVDEAIALPDGIINCTELNRLLKCLVEGMSKISQELEDLQTANEERFQTLEDAITESKEIAEPEAESDEKAVLIPCGVPIVTEPEQSETPSQQNLAKEVTSETLLKQIDEQANEFREQESKLLAVIGDLEQRLEKVEQLFYQKLEELSNEFQQFQMLVESKQTNLEATSTASMQKTVGSPEQISKLDEFTEKLDELQRQMELLLSHRDQLPLRIEALLEEKLKEGELTTTTGKKSVRSGSVGSRKGSVTPSKSLSHGRVTESAATTQALMDNLSCLACDTKNVVQRMRNGRYLAPRTTAKLAIAARRLQESDDTLTIQPGTKWSRTCGGSYTVVKPDERVFRQVNVQFNHTIQEENSEQDC
ncbi:uncharacterized protein LOC126562482 [Anopheles maculipalpis]|uniref:uncharacterized protein LOC126562482 n=1 Tax=Anopheles maculipalpis TaxID=1496333 RepID=UPI0021595466|nr:uncharacterized protein LOC126562482 [Anopheles maculipalpis]